MIFLNAVGWKIIQLLKFIVLYDVDKKIIHIVFFMHWVLIMDFMGTITNTIQFMIDRYCVPNCKVIQFIAQLRQTYH